MKLENIVTTYFNNIANYHIDETIEVLKTPKMYNLNINANMPQNNDKLNIATAMTDFCTNKYIGVLTQNFFLFVIETFNFVLNEYRKEYNLREKYDLKEEQILFLPKGGLILKILVEKNIKHNLPNNIQGIYEEKYKQYFKKSDMDFSIFIDDTLPDEKYQQIYNELIDISYYTLFYIREEIEENQHEYFEFARYNDKYQTYLLRELRNDINKIIKKKSVDDIYNTDYICKITHKNIIDEEPCQYDYMRENDNMDYDQYIYQAQNKMYIYQPVKFGTMQNNAKTMTISINKNIYFNSPTNGINKFSLVRIKNNFGIYYLPNNSNNIKLAIQKGELIDVSISHKETTEFKKHKYFSSPDIFFKNFSKLDLGNTSFYSVTLYYLIDDIEYILFRQNEYPWKDNKYKKRIFRYFAMLIILIIKNIYENKIDDVKFNSLILNINTFITYLINQFSNPSNIEQFKFDNELSPFNNISNIIYEINKKKNNFTSSDRSNYIEFNTIIIDNFGIFNDILNKIFDKYAQNEILTNRISGFFGGNTNEYKYNKYQEKYKLLLNNITKPVIGGAIEPTITKKFNNIIKKSINNIQNIDMTVKNIVINNIQDFIKIYKNNAEINQQFIDRKGNIIYDSTDINDKYMVLHERNTETRKTLINYHEQILALAYVSYLSEYLCFLITYKSYNINTTSNQTANDFDEIYWDGLTEPKRIYRNELTNNLNLLNIDNFSKNLNLLYKRCIVNLIFKLTNNINAKYFVPDKHISYDIIKNLIIAVNHKDIDILTRKNEYEFIFHFWKKNIIDFIIKNSANLSGDLKELSKQHSIIFQNNIRADINICIENVLNELSDNISGSPYSTNATGFFSWMYLYPNATNNPARKYGSCITYTYLEIYVLFRLFEIPNYVYVQTQSTNSLRIHNYWKLTQDNLTNKSFSHWVTKWRRTINDSTARSDFIFRDALTYKKDYSFLTQKKECFIVLIGPIFDNYIAFINKNSTKIPDYTIRINSIKNLLNSLLTFYDTA
jgi:hypothetical protein